MTFLSVSKFFLGLSVLMLVASVALFIYPGPKFSIEFTGGTLMQIQPTEQKTREQIVEALNAYETQTSTSFGNFSVTSIKTATEEAYVLRLPTISNEEHLALLDHLENTLGETKELKYTTIGPSLSQSLKKKSLQAIGVASVAVILYLALAFRKLPRRLKPWKFGLLAVLAFTHDVIITTGIFIVLGWFTSFELDTLFVTALLTIIANSTNEAIMVFDRVRANLTFENRDDDLPSVVRKALRQCLGRTAGTTVAILIMLTTLFFMGAESIRWFILALIVGTIIGAYSSYFIAAPLLAYWK